MTDTLVLRELPTDLTWTFGGFPYGLEPLTLPHPGTDTPADTVPGVDPVGEEARQREYVAACGRLRQLGPPGLRDDHLTRAGGDEVFWFRWLTGHQVSFVLWRLMAQLLDAVAERRVEPAAALAPLTHYVRGYCAMLLYAGSCPRAVYHRTIRPSMQLQHPSFSGGWAPDYRPVRDLFRGRRPQVTRAPGAAELIRAIALHEAVHAEVAARLVPDGRSLLRASEVRGLQNPRLLGLLYDNYFLTLRAPVSRHDVVAQLLRRLLAVLQDLAARDLHPSIAGADPGAELTRTPEVAACELDLAEICFQVAVSATRLPAGVVAGLRRRTCATAS